MSTQLTWIALLGIWFFLVFPQWARLTAIKVREMSLMSGRPYEEQLAIMHPPAVMQEMIAVRNRLWLAALNGQPVVLLVDRSIGVQPLAANAAMWRGLLQDVVAVRTPEMPAPPQDLTVYEVTSSESASGFAVEEIHD